MARLPQLKVVYSEAGSFGHEVRFKKLHPDAICPTYANDHAVGMDLYALDAITLRAGERAVVKTGIAIELPPHLQAECRPRSGLAAKHGITVVNAPGTIDPDYRGDVSVILLNTSKDDFQIEKGDRIAQLVVMPFVRAVLVESTELGSTARGENGFGSTGKR